MVRAIAQCGKQIAVSVSATKMNEAEVPARKFH